MNKKKIKKIIKDVRNLFILKNEVDDAIIKYIRNLFRLKKENELIKERIVKGIRNLLEHEKEDYYKAVRVSNFWSNNHIECESNGDRDKTLSVEVYRNETRPYLKDRINNLKKSDMWKIQWTIAINFISSKIMMKSV